MPLRIPKTWWLAFSAVFVMLLLRCFHGMDDIDEAFNIAVGRQIALGQQMFVDIWTPYQIGNLVQSFFIRGFQAFMGESTEGLVVFLRISRVFVSLAASLLLYHILKRSLPIISAWGAAVIFLFCEGYAGAHFPVFAQDYLLLIFFTLSAASIFACSQEPHGSKASKILAYSAGVSAACMVWNYPVTPPVVAAMGVALFLACKPQGMRRALGLTSLYIAGGFTVILIASALIESLIGFDKLPLFFEQYKESNLLKRDLLSFSSLKGAFIKCGIAAGTITFVAALCACVLKRPLRNVPALWVVLVSLFTAGLALLALRLLGFIGFFPGGLFQISIIGLLSPLLIFLLRPPLSRLILKQLFLTIYLPCILMFGCIMTVIFMGNVKPLVAFYPAGLIMFSLALGAFTRHESHPRYALSIIVIAVAALSVMLWTGHYNDIAPYEKSERLQSGAFKFLSTSPEKANILRELEQDLTSIKESERSIYISGRFRAAYLLTRMVPNTPSCFSGTFWTSNDDQRTTDPIYAGYPQPGEGTYHWEEALKYFKTSRLGNPDFMLLDQREIEEENIQSFLKSNYLEILRRGEYIIYRKR